MRFSYCGNPTCHAVLPFGAVYCPQCGRRRRGARSAWLWRAMFPLVVSLGLMMAGVHSARVVNLPASATPAREIITQPAPLHDVESLEQFISARSSRLDTADGKRHFIDRVAGKRVHWTGYLTPSRVSGKFALSVQPFDAGDVVQLMAATPKAARQAERIGPNARVVVDGVLMDDQWVHLMNVRPAE